MDTETSFPRLFTEPEITTPASPHVRKPFPDRPAKRDTKTTGDASEMRVILALVEAGYAVSLPFGENHRYDLIADDGARLLRVQVKTGKLRGGVIKYSCSSSHAHRGGYRRPYFGEIELLAVYCPQTRKVYLLPESQFVATQSHMRVHPPKNNIKKGIRWARHFELA
jgi:hypothetical protein